MQDVVGCSWGSSTKQQVFNNGLSASFIETKPYED